MSAMISLPTAFIATAPRHVRSPNAESQPDATGQATGAQAAHPANPVAAPLASTGHVAIGLADQSSRKFSPQSKAEPPLASPGGSAHARPTLDPVGPARQLGVAAAVKVGLRTDAYSTADLEALGEQVLLDHLLHPQGRANALAGVAQAHGKVSGAALEGTDGKQVIDETAAFFADALKDELTILDCLYDLSALKAPSRRELARSSLALAGLAPGRLMNNGWRQAIPTPRNGLNFVRKVMHGSLWESAEQYYFNADSLDDGDVRRMTAKPLDAAGLQRVHATLPQSLKARFESDYDQFAKSYASVAGRLLKTWIPAVAARHGIDISKAHITVKKVHAQQYLKDTRVLPFEVPRDLSEAREQLTGHGYVVCFGPADHGDRLFLSGLDGRAHRISAGMTLAKWVQRNTALVFGDEMTEAAGRAPLLKWRIVQEEVGHGRRADIAEWLARGLHEEMEKHREEAAGQTWNEAATDLLLNVIPLRATVMALRKGDYLQAGLSASMDAMVVLPLLAEGVRAASMAVRAAVPMMRGEAARLSVGAVRASAVADDISAVLATALRREMAGAAPERMGPLDLDRMSASLEAAHPRLAADLSAAAAQSRGMSVIGKWRRQGPTAAGASAGAPTVASGAPFDELTSASQPALFVDESGEQMSLLPYGSKPGVHTQVNDAGEAAGMLMLEDAQGNVHPAMPLHTFERYRVESGRLRNATLVRHDATEGTVVAANQHYVAVGDDYVMVMRDRSLSSGRTVWRAITPRGARADPVVHHLIYDREAGVWRRPDASEAGLRGGGGASARAQPGAVAVPYPDLPPASTADFQDALVRDASGLAGAVQTLALRGLLARLERNPRGAAILRALRAYQTSHGAGPRIVMRSGAQAGTQAARPTLAARARTVTWNLDLEALANASDKDAVDELAAVYNNMTGILEPGIVLTRTAAPLDEALEAVWRDWIAGEDDPTLLDFWDESRSESHRLTRRAVIVENLRLQIMELRDHGGITAAALKHVLRATSDVSANHFIEEGASIRLQGRLRMRRLPPIPAFVRVLDVSGNHIQDWANLPTGLTHLKANDCGLTTLPRNIPHSITHLEVANNAFSRLDLWEGLKILQIEYAHVESQLVLPSSVVSLEGRYCHLKKLVLRASSRLRKLYMPRSFLRILKGPLPQTVEFVDLSYCQWLRELPDFRVPRLVSLGLAGLQLRRVPPLPAGLRYLNLSYNLSTFPGQQLRITREVMALVDCDIDVHFTGITAADLPQVGLGQRSPTFLHLAEDLGLTSRAPRDTGDVVARWFVPDDPLLADVTARWRRIAATVEHPRQFAEFRVFIDRLAETENAKDAIHGAAFRTEVRDWLIECSKPERESLLKTTLAACLDANETCQDRTSWMFTQIKSARLNDDIEIGIYDGRVPEVIGAAREAYAKDSLEKLASSHADQIDAARQEVAETADGAGAYFRPCNRLDIYLAYLVKLGPQAGLKNTGSRAMRFFEAAGVSEADIAAAAPQLQRRLNAADFEKFLSRDFYPWKTLLERNFKGTYLEAERQMQETMTARVQAAIDAEIDRLGLDRADPEAAALIDDVVKEVGPRTRREIEDATFKGLTDGFLAAHSLTHLLTPDVNVAMQGAPAQAG